MATLYDIIGFDLDSTLTPSKSPLEADMAELLGKLLIHFKVAVISGASYGQFEKQFLAHLPCSPAQLVNLYILPTDGIKLCQYDIQGKKWSCASDYTFSEVEVRKISDAFEKTFTEVGFVKPEKIYGDLLENRGDQITFSAFGMEAPLDIKTAWDPDHQKREKMLQVLRPLLPDFSVRIGGTTSIDVTAAGIDKAYGLKKILKLLNIPAERMLYIGDELFPDGNDAPAETIGATCLVVSGPEETKKAIQKLLSDL